MLTTIISTTEIGQRRGCWATAAVDEFGLYGVLLGRCDDDSSLAVFIPEDKLAAASAGMPADLQAVFDGAVQRLDQFKLSRRALVQ
jgi:hypothetical protein